VRNSITGEWHRKIVYPNDGAEELLKAQIAELKQEIAMKDNLVVSDSDNTRQLDHSATSKG
jgi:hypothetical protein